MSGKRLVAPSPGIAVNVLPTRIWACALEALISSAPTAARLHAERIVRLLWVTLVSRERRPFGVHRRYRSDKPRTLGSTARNRRIFGERLPPPTSGPPASWSMIDDPAALVNR